MDVKCHNAKRHTILAHRGIWKKTSEQNSREAIVRAATNGFSLEIDLRDQLGEIVLSHNPAEGSPLRFEKVLTILSEKSFSGVLGLNVKSDGLVPLVSEYRDLLAAIDYFFFDMSFPESRRYKHAGYPVARRRSEFEHGSCDLFRVSRGEVSNVWVDSFETDWWLNLDADDIAPRDSRCFFVSPELHGRDPEKAWHRIRELYKEGRQIGICTDRPEEFSNFLGGDS